MSANGRVAAGQLITVQLLPTIKLERRTGVAFKALKVDAKRFLGRTIKIAPPGGGYRSFAVQDEMHRASYGNVALAKKWKLNPFSRVKVAPAGNSTHGWGTRVDIIGTPMDARFLALAKKHGFVREFGPADPNHFEWID